MLKEYTAPLFETVSLAQDSAMAVTYDDNLLPLSHLMPSNP